MAETKWTKDQQNAIQARGGTLLLSAAAGSGKTAVLVERIIKLLTDAENPVDPSELLVVTFTNAAAAEMRVRITSAVDKLIASEPSNSFYRNIKMKLPEAKITTMDSFCISLVRENFHAADVEPDFTPIESGEERILIADAMSEMLDNLCRNSPDVYNLLNTMTAYNKNDDGLAKKVMELYRFSLSHPFPERWLSEVENMYNTDGDIRDSLWGKIILEDARQTVKYASELLRNAMSEVLGHEVIEPKYLPAFSIQSEFVDNLSNIIETKTWDEICENVKGIKLPSLPAAPRGYGQDRVKVSAEAKYKTAASALEGLEKIFCASTEEHSEDMQKLRPVITGLIDAVRDFKKIYDERKRERNTYTFSDIMHFALRLLVNETENGYTKTSLAYELEQRYHEILIDEYQDTNEAQDMLFTVLSKNGNNMFMVGDVKQSIYRFRLAMPEIFMKKSREFCDYDGENFPAKIFLAQNFRSRKGVLDNINFFFRNMMSDYAGEMEYTAKDALYYSDVYDEESKTPDVSLHFFAGEGIEDEAEYVADIIEKTVASGVTVSAKDGKRKVRYGDFCILLRSLKGKAEYYENALRRRNIKVLYEKKTSLFDTVEAGVFISLLKVINNPTDDVALLSVMFSPLYGFTADEAAQVRMSGDKKKNIYSCLKSFAENNKKAKKLLSDIASYRRMSAVMPFDLFLRTLLESTGYQAIVSAMRDGEDRRMNLLLLCSLGSDYSSRGGTGIGGFLRYLSRAAESGAEIGAATAGVSDTNAVRITSIHKSKGLEFPYVIIADCSKKINKSDATEDMIVSPSAGVGMVILNNEKLQKYSSLGHMAAKLAVKRATVSEELRILYVAMTRAREKLIAVSTIGKMENELKGAYVAASCSSVPPYSVINAQTYTKWLLMGYMRHPDMNSLLRENGYSLEADISGADSRLSVVYAGLDEQDNQEIAGTEIAVPDEDKISEIRQRAEYVYPYIMPSDARPKRVASDFEAHRFNEMYFAKTKPDFMNDGKLGAAEAGTANHLFMQNFDFDCPDSVKECRRMVDSGILTDEQAKAIRHDKVDRFIRSPLFERIRNADAVYREKDFTVQIRLGDIDNTVNENVADEKILILGKADLVFEENDGIVVVDYKTDRTKTVDDFREAYSGQLEMYAKAMEQLLEKEVKEKIIYSLELGEEIVL